MAMPNPFQKLKHGVLLCKKNFNTFVETFNFLVDFAQNIKGDGDANGNGTIVFDRTVPDRPVIRSKINADYPFSKAGEDHGRFNIADKGDQSGGSSTIVFANGYYRVGGKTYEMESLSKLVPASSIVAVRVSMSGSQPEATLETYSSVSDLNTAEADMNYYIMPLYQFDANFNVVCDFRIGPDSAAWEFAQ